MREREVHEREIGKKWKEGKGNYEREGKGENERGKFTKKKFMPKKV
jgi:hypothetical protein